MDAQRIKKLSRARLKIAVYVRQDNLKKKIESKIDSSSEIEGVVEIGRGGTIVKSKIIGPTIIGDNVTIESSEIGPYTSISDNCQIINSRVENSVLMRGVKIIDVVEHPVKGSLIGTDTEVLGTNGKTANTSIFVGEKSKIQV